MKRPMDDINLRNAFAPEPDFCHAALMDAARSVKEEQQVKRTSFRVVLIAAIVTMAMSAVAFAAGRLMNWTDFYGDYSNVGVPHDAVEQMQVAEEYTWQVGPLTFTVKELLTDGHIAMSSIHVSVTDGSPALLCIDPWDVIGCNGENGQAYAQRLGIDPMTSYIDAAKQLGLPLYSVRGILDIAPEYSGGEAMEDPMWNEDGSVVYFSMPTLNPGAVQGRLEAGLFLRAAQIDPETGEETEKWVDRDQTVTIAVSPVLEEKTYLPEGDAVVAGHTLQAVTAVRYVTGAYLTLHYEMNPMSISEDVYGLYDVTLMDEQGAPLPGGMNLSTSLCVSIQVEEMIGVDALPEVITLADGTVLKAK